MTTITITLPDDLAQQAKEKGLLSPTAMTAIETYVRDRLQETHGNSTSWDTLFAALDQFPADFMADGRNQPEIQERENLFA